MKRCKILPRGHDKIRESQVYKTNKEQRIITIPKARDVKNNLWILEYMWRLVDTSVPMRQDPMHNQSLLLCLGCQIKVILKV